jgi:hypothetical protein
MYQVKLIYVENHRPDFVETYENWLDAYLFLVDHAYLNGVWQGELYEPTQKEPTIVICNW